VLRIGETGDLLLALLPDLQSWAFITAWNPLPEILTSAENQARNKELSNIMTEKGYRYHSGVGRSDAGDWQEDSFLIENITLDEAKQLAKQFGQLAFVYWEKGIEIKLLYSD
jgi:hypothetical protein